MRLRFKICLSYSFCRLRNFMYLVLVIGNTLSEGKRKEINGFDTSFLTKVVSNFFGSSFVWPTDFLRYKNYKQVYKKLQKFTFIAKFKIYFFSKLKKFAWLFIIVFAKSVKSNLVIKSLSPALYNQIRKERQCCIFWLTTLLRNGMGCVRTWMGSQICWGQCTMHQKVKKLHKALLLLPNL